MVQYQQYGTVPTVWYSTNSMYGSVPTVCMVEYQQYGTVPTVCMVEYQQYGTVPTVWYSTNSTVQYQQWCDTNVKYNNEPSQTGVAKNDPVGSWRAGMQQQKETLTKKQ